MSEDVYKQLIQFEQILKNCIVDRFGTSLSQDKKNVLLNGSYLDKEKFATMNSGNEIQGKILRDMLKSIISIKSIKEFTLDNGTKMTLPIGEDIESEIIEFYATNIADKYQFGIDAKNPKLTLAFGLIEGLGSNVDNAVLNNDINAIFAMPGVAHFAKTYTDDLLSNYSTAKTNDNSNSPMVIVDDPVTSETPISEEIDILSLTNTPDSTDEIIETISLEPTLDNATPEQQTQNNVADKQGVVSEEQYKELCMKYARNETLTPEEFNVLLMATPELVSEEDKLKMTNTTANLSDSTEKHEVIFRGFTITAFPTYFVILSIVLLVILGIIIL